MPEENEFYMCWMYHRDCPEGKIFKLIDPETQRKEAEAAGWVDSPAKLKEKKKRGRPKKPAE